MIFGAHLSIQGGFDKTVERARNIECESVQVFTKSQRQWAAKPLTQSAITSFLQAFKSSSLCSPVVHASYLINLASDESQLREKSRDALIDELKRANQLQIPYVVVHCGAHKRAGIEKGLANFVESVRFVLHHTEECEGTSLLLENSAGQGTTLCRDLKELEFVFKEVNETDNLGACLDTCHLFAGGYDFHNRIEYNKLVEELEQLQLLRKVKVLHFNDSAKPLASKVDKHAEIGSGHIGAEAFRFWIQDERWGNIPAIVETPGGIQNFQREIALFKKMREHE